MFIISFQLKKSCLYKQGITFQLKYSLYFLCNELFHVSPLSAFGVVSDTRADTKSCKETPLFTTAVTCSDKCFYKGLTPWAIFTTCSDTDFVSGPHC